MVSDELGMSTRTVISLLLIDVPVIRSVRTMASALDSVSNRKIFLPDMMSAFASVRWANSVAKKSLESSRSSSPVKAYSQLASSRPLLREYGRPLFCTLSKYRILLSVAVSSLT